MQNYKSQSGISLVGLIFVLGLLAFVGLIGMKVVPTFSEYQSIKTAIQKAKESGTTVAEIRGSFDRQAEVAYITSISGKDLEITKVDNNIEISFAYDKKIPLFGPASLLLEYQGTTAKNQGSGGKKG